MILDLDIGNSRVKWRLSSLHNECVTRGAVDLEALLAGDVGNHGAKIARVRVSSVKGIAIDERIGRWVRSRFGLQAEFARPSARCGRLQNGYREPARLGVDRWLAILAAYEEFQCSVCVFDLGSAMTADLVDADGRHRGGYIAPGLRLMRESLLGGTDRVRFDTFPAGDLNAPGVDTAEAVAGGVLASAAGFASTTYAIFSALVSPVQVVLSGGDAGEVGRLLPFPYAHRPELVLDGLAVALP